jgi:lauroyl/myristoyl acyltransferase
VRLITVKDVYLLTVIALIRASSAFSSVKWPPFLARTVAVVAYRLSRRKRRSSENNLVQVFEGTLSRERLQAIVRSSFYQFWLEVLSMPYRSVSQAAVDAVEMNGLEHLQAGLKQGNGVILWESSYFGRRLLAKEVLYKKGFAIEQVHAQTHLGGFGHSRDAASSVRERMIRPFFEHCERLFVKDIIYLTDPGSLRHTRVLANRLKQNRILCISADGPRGQKFISVPFLGRTLAFPTGIVSLAKISGAPILPLFCFADKKGRTKLTILPPVEISSEWEREQALERAILQFTAVLDGYIRRYPEQYRNWHYVWGPLPTAPDRDAR